MTRTLTGWHVLAMFCGGFGIIIGVNLLLAYKAVATFPGLEVPNSYVASQTFDRDRAAQVALGWTVTPGLTADRLTVRIEDSAGQPVHPASIAAILGRATHVAEDRVPEFVWTGTDFAAPVDMVPGYWSLRLRLTADDGTLWQRLYPLYLERDPG